MLKQVAFYNGDQKWPLATIMLATDELLRERGEVV